MAFRNQWKQDVPLITRKVLLMAAVLLGFALITVIEFILMSVTQNTAVILVAAVLLNALLIAAILKRSSAVGLKGNGLHRVINTLFGLFCYLGMILQLGLVFYFLYLLEGNAAVLTKPTLDAAGLATTAAGTHVTNILNHVLPHFYEFPVNLGTLPVVQHFIGKFTDIFLLAFVVDKAFLPDTGKDSPQPVG